MNDQTKSKSVASYYSRPGSWIGYNLVLGRSQHAGYWESDTKNERQAQANYLKKIKEMMAIQPSDKVLDAGSGQGYAARYLAAETGASITGITITPREVSVSSRLSKGHPNLTFVLGDYAATNFENSQFDVIYTTETLVHATDMKQTMDEFYRILKPGGRVYFFDYEINTTNMEPYMKDVFDFLYDHAGGFGIGQQNPGQISALLNQAGFTRIVEEDWSEKTKPTYDRLRRIAMPLRWIKPNSKLAPYFINVVMANHGYSSAFEAGRFRYIVYSALKPEVGNE